ncbi:MlaC/ttg2D family ABC transporter substrate-binding protein [Candidatus Odyssella thessalonicensis]|uniref:MlaC/ttg2D family ABC transporter substrate-binding protein n=1 Tax=Candidatus Odyssella thessalonicensis TaxID=84647 RepID=UPI000225A91B|nr:ABC transporter substrate-binding protein [Candidatus Odyssella thessalonicensis]
MMKLTRIIFLGILLIGAGWCGTSKALIQDLGNRAILTLTNSNDSPDQIEQRFVALLEEGFDVRSIAQFVMGSYWRQATPAQKERFIGVFKDRLKKAYANRFREYRGVDFKIGDVSQRAGSDIVKSTIQKPGSPKTDVEWQVKNNKIHDVVIEGISMSITLRDDYRSLLNRKNGDIEAFLKDLEAKK